VGLSEIDKSVSALQYMPMMFRTLEEVDYVRQAGPYARKKAAGERLRSAVLGGRRLDTVLLQRAGPASHGFQADENVQLGRRHYRADLMKAAGYQPVPLEINDIFPAFRTA
jgi:hypothetical protein